jgi:ABC-2 type transport system permease protein
MLARTEFKLRYFGSALGYLWSLVRPLLFFGVLLVVFTKVFHLSSISGKRAIRHYPVYLLTSIVLWTYFVEATNGCVTCLQTREGLLRKVRFPRMTVPLSVSLTSAFNLGMNFIAVLIFALASGVEPRLSWLQLVPIALGFMVLATGTGMLLSALYVRFRDVKPIWEVLAQLGFYASPVMYPAAQYKSLEHVALLNPVAMLLTQMGHAFIDPVRGSTAAQAAGGGVRLLIPIFIIVALFVLGWWVFVRETPRVAENL